LTKFERDARRKNSEGFTIRQKDCYPSQNGWQNRPVYLGFAEKVFRGGRVWGVGFYRFSGGQLPNFQGKST